VTLGNTDDTLGEELITAPASGKGKVKVWNDADADRLVTDNPLMSPSSPTARTSPAA
jgi:hypothetical protein